MSLIVRFASLLILVISAVPWSLAAADSTVPATDSTVQAELTEPAADPTAQAESKALSLKEMINLAGRQRMLSQRIVKLYCQIGLGVYSEESYLNLLEDVNRFEQQYRILKDYSDDQVYQEMLEWVGIAWKRFKPLVTAPVIRDKLLRINHLAEDLLYTSNQITIFLQDSVEQRNEMLVNISGRMRMFAQRLGKLYLMKSWGFNQWSVNNEMKRIRQEYALTLIRLRSAPENSREIRDSLIEVNQQWIQFKKILEREGDRWRRLEVADASDALLQMMDAITNEYAKSDE